MLNLLSFARPVIRGRLDRRKATAAFLDFRRSRTS